MMAALKSVVVAFAFAALCGCSPAAEPAPVAGPAGAEQSILVKSNPAANSTVNGPVDKIELWFDPPARLGEVVVSGPGGQMPMMVTAVGEVGYYSLPVSLTDPGVYTVSWTATVGGREHRGSFQFTLR